MLWSYLIIVAVPLQSDGDATLGPTPGDGITGLAIAAGLSTSTAGVHGSLTISIKKKA